jgi:ATP-dependent RNA helicase DDX19/DBP5
MFFYFVRPQNMIAQSQSGTGKTAAFVLAMLSRTDVTKNYPHVVCLSPTFELAIQTGEVAKKMAKFCPHIRIRYAVRGEESNELLFFNYFNFSLIQFHII